VAEEESYPIRVKWVDKLQFVGSDRHNHSIIIDTSTDAGGEDLGLGPMNLLLCALGSCTAMDIVDILRKQRQTPTYFHVLLKGERNKEYPKYYKKIEVRYIVKGKNVEKTAVERAIRLSREKYCSVEATLLKSPEIVSSYDIVNE
jgi:putative redox protein